MSDENTLTEDGLPSDFWNVPEKFIQNEGLRLLHADVCVRLRQENPEADTLELMSIERIASLFFYMRDREQRHSLDNAAAYKSMMALWVSMAADLRKNRTGLADEQQIRKQITGEVAQAARHALQGLDPEVANVVRRRLAESLGAS